MDKEMKFKVDTAEDRAEIKEEAKQHRLNLASMDIDNFFNNFIKKNKFIKDETFGNGIKVQLRPLNVGELIEAEAIIRNSNPNIPMDSMIKLRSAAILSKALVSLDGNNIDRVDFTDEENQMRRFSLYANLIQMPPSLITELYSKYLLAVQEQEEFYSSSGDDLDSKISDFSTPPSEK